MIISDKSRKAMESLGLTGYEIKVYLSILEKGPAVASEISKMSGVPYSDIRSHQQLRRQRLAGVKQLQTSEILSQISAKRSSSDENPD